MAPTEQPALPTLSAAVYRSRSSPRGLRVARVRKALFFSVTDGWEKMRRRRGCWKEAEREYTLSRSSRRKEHVLGACVWRPQQPSF